MEAYSSKTMPTSKPNYHGSSNETVPKNRPSPKPKHLIFEASRHPADREDFEATGNETYIPANKGKKNSYM